MTPMQFAFEAPKDSGEPTPCSVAPTLNSKTIARRRDVAEPTSIAALGVSAGVCMVQSWDRYTWNQ